MFGLFKKTSWEIKGKSLEFFREVFRQLPAEFDFLTEGLEKGLYRKYAFDRRNLYLVHLNPSLIQTFKKEGEQFELKNILIQQDGETFPLQLTIYSGIWFGFEIKKNIQELDNIQIDISSCQKRVSRFSPRGRIEALVSGLASALLDFEELKEFKIEEKKYYRIKEFKNGKHLVVNNKANVFLLAPDTNKVQRISESVSGFVNQVNTGRIDLDHYEQA